MTVFYVFDVVCTLFGCYGGAFAGVCFDDFGAHVVRVIFDCNLFV